MTSDVVLSLVMTFNRFKIIYIVKNNSYMSVFVMTLVVSYFNYFTEANNESPDEMAHKEPSHLDFQCLQMDVRICLMSEATRLCPNNDDVAST